MGSDILRRLSGLREMLREALADLISLLKRSGAAMYKIGLARCEDLVGDEDGGGYSEVLGQSGHIGGTNVAPASQNIGEQ